MDRPRILAIDDVHLSAPSQAVEALVAFYAGLIGLHSLAGDREGRVQFYGRPRSGPKLVFNLTGEQKTEPRPRSKMTIQIASLTECADMMAERGAPYEWSQGLYFFDRRLIVQDPLGHRVEFVSYHPL